MRNTSKRAIGIVLFGDRQSPAFIDLSKKAVID